VRIVLRFIGFILISFNTYKNAGAQLCQGSLGDPIVNITFGAGSNPGSPLAAASTNYQYVSSDCPNDGFYTVRNSTTSCFSNTWHSLNADHTGDANGYFMLVNASIQPSAFYVDTVRGLCSNTTFEFAAWVINVLQSSACGSNGIQPNLTFTIERTNGTVLQTYNSGNIPAQASPQWRQFGFFFTTPVGITDVVLRIVNNSQGGCGNDLALDDITFRPCGPQVSAAILNNPSSAITLCEGNAASYTFTSTISAGYSNPSFQWQQSLNGSAWTDIAGANSATLTINFQANMVPGNYSYRLSVAESGNLGTQLCRVNSSVLSIIVASSPVTTITTNSPVCEGINLTLTATGGTQYQWSGVNNYSANGASVVLNNTQIAQSGKYFVLVTNNGGCTRLDSAIVTVNPTPVATTNISTASICEGDNIQLQSFGGTGYQWIPATRLSSATISNPLAAPLDTIQYSIVISNQFACSDTAQVTINVIEKPKAFAGPDKYILESQSVQLSGSVAGQGISYSWSPLVNIDNAFSITPVVNPVADIDYTLTVTSNTGCGTASDVVHIYVYKDIFVPTGFTPDNKGKNDTWNIPGLNAFNNYEVSVYNRYGGLVFHTKNVAIPWDGKYKGIPQPIGVYVFVIALKDQNRLIKGTVMLIR